ncbi:hypothetical protein LTR36_009911 [Oleoguttula mirabilis]|uniref:Myb-like DNA-binding domain-containing protein n=1 Tax=Oleoguttula mirabilis TaxID=1507867 RepID=A0AAV9J4X0_9PEZI|nr:hypothetical protein LTR36_009911 [Oleoguttula mirabilis]
MAEEAANTSGFTVGETKILMCMMKHLKGGEFPTDYEAVANELGYKDAKQVRSRWSQIKAKKINGASNPAEKTTPKTTPKKRKGKSDSADGLDDEETPKPKRGRKSNAQKAKEEEEAAAAAASDVKKEEVEEEEEGEANVVESTEVALEA